MINWQSNRAPVGRQWQTISIQLADNWPTTGPLRAHYGHTSHPIYLPENKSNRWWCRFYSLTYYCIVRERTALMCSSWTIYYCIKHSICFFDFSNFPICQFFWPIFQILLILNSNSIVYKLPSLSVFDVAF